MKCKKILMQSFSPVTSASALLLFMVAILAAPVAMALTVTVTGADNSVSPVTETPLSGYRWLIEEDATYHVPFNPVGTVQRSGGTPVVAPNWQVGPHVVTSPTEDSDTPPLTLPKSISHMRAGDHLRLSSHCRLIEGSCQIAHLIS